ncbi:hypothetical protein BH11MYX3_BH11MYX3_32890 [soil metagenome]
MFARGVSRMRRWGLGDLGMRSTLALGLVVLVGCGGGDGVALDDVPDLFRSEYCQYLSRCHLVQSQSECEALNIGIDLHIDASLRAAIDAGKVHYDGGKLSECYGHFGDQSCDRTSEGARAPASDACNEALAGTVGAGGVCALDAECVSQSCNVPDCPDACCQGTCIGDTPPPTSVAIGGACETTSDCARSYCDSTTSVCAAFKVAGATCTAATECDYDLGCAGTPRTCKAMPKLGEACPDGACRDVGNYCNTATMTCARVGLPGDPCTTRVDCSGVYICDATSHCATGPREGEACSSTLRCSQIGNFCDPTSMTCRPPQADGAMCTSDSQCTSSFCSDDTVRVCAVEPVCF